ncbi:MAG TPA: peptide chain release factor N(5)-glutamine methyltransferase [Solirubrobacterales bacterium]|jgi:release factor glutamine methyltransferase
MTVTAPATAGSVREALGASIDALRAAGVETPGLDAELLLAEASGRERADLLAAPDDALSADVGRRFGEMVRRRLRREPVAYILGRRGFRSIELKVDRRVLIPRPETELLVELALELQPARLLDVGTGSGAIALAVTDEMPDCRVVATDVSPAALEVARTNAGELGVADRVRFEPGMLPSGTESFDLILANLPYVAEGEWAALPPEVREWEPREALLAGVDGLDAIRALLADRERTSVRYPAESAFARLNTQAVGLEVGEGQASAVVALMREAGFKRTEVRTDLAGIERVVLGLAGR